MKYIFILVATCFLTSCFDEENDFEKEFFEKTTRMKFPISYEVLEAFDNGEFLTGAVLQMDSLTLQKFINENHFDAVSSYLDASIVSGKNYLEENKPVFSTFTNVYFKRKSERRIHWIYVADLNRERLWVEINYPDWSGH